LSSTTGPQPTCPYLLLAKALIKSNLRKPPSKGPRAEGTKWPKKGLQDKCKRLAPLRSCGRNPACPMQAHSITMSLVGKKHTSRPDSLDHETGQDYLSNLGG